MVLTRCGDLLGRRNKEIFFHVLCTSAFTCSHVASHNDDCVAVKCFPFHSELSVVSDFLSSPDVVGKVEADHCCVALMNN